jgi:hypothetical protein
MLVGIFSNREHLLQQREKLSPTKESTIPNQREKKGTLQHREDLTPTKIEELSPMQRGIVATEREIVSPTKREIVSATMRELVSNRTEHFLPTQRNSPKQREALSQTHRKFVSKESNCLPNKGRGCLQQIESCY